MALTIIELTPQLCPAWDDFVLRHADGSPFHLVAWKNSIEETFHYRPLYALAMEEGKVQGILPLFLIRNLVIGKGSVGLFQMFKQSAHSGKAVQWHFSTMVPL